MERRQVFDLPEVTVMVTGHQLIERECGCGHRTRAAAPAGAEGPVQYGPRTAAVIVYLYAGQFCAIRSYLSTAAKHGLGVFDALVMLTEGQPWTPAAA